MNRYEQFQAYRTKMNSRILGDDAARAAAGAARADGSVAPGAFRIADWSDGQPLLAAMR